MEVHVPRKKIMTPGEVIQAVLSPGRIICQKCHGKMNHNSIESGVYICGSCLIKGTPLEKSVFLLQMKVKELNNKIKQIEKQIERKLNKHGNI